MALNSTVEVLGQNSTDNPTSNYSDWMLAINGAVNNTLRLSVNDLVAMPKTVAWGTIYCYGEPVTEGTWGGVLLSNLISQAGLLKSASNLEFHAYDGYIIKVAVAYMKNMIIAYELDGQPLKEHLRLVPLGYEGNYWINQITEIRVTSSTNYDIGPAPVRTTPTPKPTMPRPPTKAPTSTPTQQQSTSPEPTELPATPIPTPILPISPKPDTSQIATQQEQQEPATTPDSASYNNIPMLVITIVIVVTTLFLFLFRKTNNPIYPKKV